MELIAQALAFALSCTAPHIVDGDTLTCDGRIVRLVGIDAPEMPGHPCRRSGDLAAMCSSGILAFATPARMRLEALTRGAVVCTPAGNRIDRYGRTVARCEVAGLDVGRQLVREGLAMEWKRYSGGSYAANEAAARPSNSGMWAAKP